MKQKIVIKEKTWQELQLEKTIKDYTILYGYCFRQVLETLPESVDRDLATATIFEHVIKKCR